MESHPEPRSLKGWLHLFFCGFCMGAADIIPGVSGGTIAFILEIYENFISSIKSFTFSSLALLFRGRWKEFSQTVSWKYLLAILLGIVCAIATLANLIKWILHHPTYQMYLYGAFLGLILASAIYCARKVTQWHARTWCGFFVGIVIAFACTQLPPTPHAELSSLQIVNPWLIFCGAIAISAMLLPGISGSYLLVILGSYPLVIESIANLVQGLKTGSVDLQAFFNLFNLSIGILIGAVIFSRLISWCLKHYHNTSVAALTGFMIGALPLLWPFSSYEPSAANGITLICTVAGFIIVLGLERIAQRKKVLKD